MAFCILEVGFPADYMHHNHENLTSLSGTPGDYNRWEELGNVGWGYKDLERYFVKSESTQTHPRSAFRGKEGAHPSFWLSLHINNVC